MAPGGSHKSSCAFGTQATSCLGKPAHTAGLFLLLVRAGIMPRSCASPGVADQADGTDTEKDKSTGFGDAIYRAVVRLVQATPKAEKFAGGREEAYTTSSPYINNRPSGSSITLDTLPYPRSCTT